MNFDLDEGNLSTLKVDLFFLSLGILYIIIGLRRKFFMASYDFF